MIWSPGLFVKVPAESVRNVFMREPLFGHLKMAIQQSGGLRFKLHEDPSVEGGPFGRLLISHGESLMEVAKTIHGAH
jgi:hypothetical protein